MAAEDYPNDGESYQLPDYNYDPAAALTDDQKLHEAQLAATMQNAIVDRKAIRDWFIEQVEACDSRRTIAAYAVTHGVSKELAGEAFDIMRELLEAKAKEFGAWSNDHE